MSLSWIQNDKKPTIKNETTNDDENSNHSTSSNATSSSSNIQTNRLSSNNQQEQEQQQQGSILDSVYSESTVLKNINVASSNNLQQEQYPSTNGKINLSFRHRLSFQLDSSSFTGQFIRHDLQQPSLSYPDTIMYYGDGMPVDSLQQNYSHLQQGKNHIENFINFFFFS